MQGACGKQPIRVQIIMKRVTRILTTLAIALAGATAQAEVTGNIGWMSDYIFRGIPLANSSAMLGLDWSQDEGGFYTGVWAANVDPGAEMDFYGGYTGQVDDFSYGIGFTVYSFTEAFDENATELNLSGSWKFLSLEANFGQYDSNPQQDFSYFAVTLEQDGFYGMLGAWGADFDGDYIKAGYRAEYLGLDFDAYYNYSNSDLIEFFGAGTGSDTSIVLTVSKSFSLSNIGRASSATE
jgi:uncharacterized protein (TIGR02001 family)